MEGVLHDLVGGRAIYKPKIFPDGNQWCALYGSSVKNGVCGFGDTPVALAMTSMRNGMVGVSDTVMSDLELQSGQSIGRETLHQIIAGNCILLLKPEPPVMGSTPPPKRF